MTGDSTFRSAPFEGELRFVEGGHVLAWRPCVVTGPASATTRLRSAFAFFLHAADARPLFAAVNVVADGAAHVIAYPFPADSVAGDRRGLTSICLDGGRNVHASCAELEDLRAEFRAWREMT